MAARLGVRARLTALFALIFGLTLVSFSVVVYKVFTHNLQNEFDADLFNHALDVSQAIEIDLFGNVGVSPDVLSMGKIFPFSVGNSFLQITTLNGTVVARSRSLGKAEIPRNATDLRALQSQGAVFRTLNASEFKVEGNSSGARLARAATHYRMLAYLVVKPGVTLLLQLVVPMTLVEEQSRGLIAFFGILIPFTLIVAALGGLFLSRRALAPVAGMIDKARRLSPASLGERIPVPAARDEVRELALTLNGLLDRMQQAFDSQERFVADASHQLKTPLAILRGELDVLRKGRDRALADSETEAFLTSASQELEYLSRMVEDLLLLARVDAGEAAMAVGPVRLDEVALEAVSRLRPLAQSRGVSVRLDLNAEHGEPEYEVSGDSDLLRSLMQSLIENAIKYSSAVAVSVSSEADWIWVRVQDQGPGIPEEQLEKIFERFYRVGGQGVGGTGLGLAIAKRISEVHHGLLLAESELGKGSRFSFGMRRG